MNRRALIIFAGLTSLAVAMGVAMAMMQDTARKTQPSSSPSVTTMNPMAPESSSTPKSSVPTLNSGTNSTPTKSPSAIANQPKVEPSRDVQSCTIKMVVVDDPEPPLNVRSSPTTTAQNIVGTVQNGIYLTVVKEQDGWFQITEPQGWVAKSRTRYGCNEKVERVIFGTGNTAAEISDRFIGTGFHKYLLNAKAGQTITVTRQSGPIPYIVKPDGQLLAEIPDERDRWSGELPTSGDYALQLDSNYKGYTYSFLVEIK